MRAEGRSPIVNSSFTVNTRKPPPPKANGAAFWAAPRRSAVPSVYWFAARLAFGGKAELVVTPRIRSSADLSALSSFGSGGT